MSHHKRHTAHALAQRDLSSSWALTTDITFHCGTGLTPIESIGADNSDETGLLNCNPFLLFYILAKSDSFFFKLTATAPNPESR